MKIGFASDLHFEFGMAEIIIPNDIDVFILAGDIHVTPIGSMKVIELIRQQTSVPILYILGNHEYYFQRMPSITSTYKVITKRVKDAQVLDCKSAIINGVKFFGLTLWSNLSNPLDAFNALTIMNDYKYIRIGQGNKTRTILPTDTTKIWLESKTWLRKALEEEFNGPKVVISHHSPSGITRSDQFRNNKIERAYFSNLEDIIIDYKPNLWIYGHDHIPAKHKLEDTILISSPAGYPFNRDLIREPVIIQTIDI
jgi:Icc-related predicted phosphoesterase